MACNPATQARTNPSCSCSTHHALNERYDPMSFSRFHIEARNPNEYVQY